MDDMKMLINKILEIEKIGNDAEINLTKEEIIEYKKNIVGREHWWHDSKNSKGTFATIYYNSLEIDIEKQKQFVR
jgi:hypothetical protein